METTTTHQTAEAEALAKIENKIQKVAHEMRTGLITEEQFNLRVAKITDEIEKKFEEGKFKEMSERISGLAEKLTKEKTDGASSVKMTRRQALKTLLGVALTSESFQNLRNGKLSKTEEFSLNTRAISVSTDYDGTIGKTSFINQLEVEPMEFPAIREILPQGTTENSAIVHPYAKDFNPAEAEYDENAEIQEGSFAFDETTSYVQRFGTSFAISKNYLRNGSLNQMINIMLARAEKQVVRRENFLLLNGTGAQGKIKGLLNAAPVLDIDAGTSGSAGSIASVALHKTGQVIVTFTANHSLRTGYKLTIANSVNYNATYDVIVRSLNSVLITAAYVAEATAAWTFTSAHPLKDAIDNARYYDALNVLIASANFNEYMVTGGIIHPLTCQLFYERDTTGQLIALPGVSETSQTFTFNGVPFVKSTDMPFKKVIVGDFMAAVEVQDLEAMTLQISEDTLDKKKNQYTVIISQQTGMPIINQYVMLQADLDTVKTAIEKP